MTPLDTAALFAALDAQLDAALVQLERVRGLASQFLVAPASRPQVREMLDSLWRADVEIRHARTALWDAHTQLTGETTDTPAPPSSPFQAPDFMLVIQGDYDERGLEQFRRKILKSNTTAGAAGDGWRVPIIPGSRAFDHDNVSCADWPALPYPPPIAEDKVQVYKDGRVLTGEERAAALASLVHTVPAS